MMVWALLALEARAQEAGRSPHPVEVSGNINVNSQGISLVPALTLGRPSTIVDVAVRKGAVSFEPQFRFALDGKPWSFLLWGRYRAVSTDNFRMVIGGHPAYSFKASTVEIDGRSRDQRDMRRYLAADATPTWRLSSNVRVGGYYLYSNGFDPGAAKHTQMAAARASFSNVGVFGELVVHATPQVYYLRTSGQVGTYVGANASFGRRGSRGRSAPSSTSRSRPRCSGARLPLERRRELRLSLSGTRDVSRYAIGQCRLTSERAGC